MAARKRHRLGMAMKEALQRCPLCTTLTEASARPRSYGQWMRYQCRNDECGPSEISTKARSHLRRGERQAELRSVAKSCRHNGARLRIGYDGPTGEFQLEVVE
ncbi:hypothetical protein [Cupriavidus gilardii]|uniref:hypothetical protein n=1 Tax=Cupriavidus gilardii TaxID=82541 RepID=UPI001FC94FEA|nr:hypothetical protein [Cupriavidus gilardii]